MCCISKSSGLRIHNFCMQILHACLLGFSIACSLCIGPILYALNSLQLGMKRSETVSQVQRTLKSAHLSLFPLCFCPFVSSARAGKVSYHKQLDDCKIKHCAQMQLNIQRMCVDC